jgi:histidine triad (HIT) family protein
MPTMTHDCVFCRIASGAIASHRIHHSERVIAIMDIHPIRAGHVLVLPVQHYRYFDDMPDDIANEVFAVVRRLAPALRSVYDVERVALFFTGVDVPHAHAHVVPMVELTDVTSGRYITESPLTLCVPPMAASADLAESSRRILQALPPPGPHTRVYPDGT